MFFLLYILEYLIEKEKITLLTVFFLISRAPPLKTLGIKNADFGQVKEPL